MGKRVGPRKLGKNTSGRWVTLKEPYENLEKGRGQKFPFRGFVEH